MSSKGFVLLGLVFAILTTGGRYAHGKESTESLEKKAPVTEAGIVHIPVASLRENEKLVVEARVDGAVSRVSFMRLYFKGQPQGSFDYIEMTEQGASFVAELPADRFSPPQLSYFILALMSDGKVITHPKWNPYGTPHVVGVASGGRRPSPQSAPPAVSPSTTRPPAARDTSPQTPPTESFDTFDQAPSEVPPFLILSPEDNAEFGADEEILMAVSFNSLEDSIDVSSVNIFIDGSNVTHNAEVTENLLTYSAGNLQPGRHQLMVQGYYVSGAQVPTEVLIFFTEGEVARESSNTFAQGRVFAETRHENISSVGFSDNNIGGNLFGQYGSLKYGARLYLTSREDDTQQPRNRYSVDLNVPIAGVTVGDSYPRFNDLMLWGKRVRGVHGGIYLGFFNIEAVYGETVRKVNAERIIDPATGQPFMDVSGLDSLNAGRSRFRQRVWGIRPSFGGGKNFQLAFNFLQVRDDTTSLTAREVGQLPEDNLVVGSDLMFAFDNKRIEFRAASALSFHTFDIGSGPAEKDSLEKAFDVELPFDPADLSDFLIINSSTTPLDPRDLTSLAFNFNLNLNYFNNNIQLGYRSIGSQYLSLGNSFLRNNIRGFYINDRFRLLQNRLYINLGYEDYDDNFDPDNENPTTNLRTITAGFSFFPDPKWPNLTFNVRHHNRDNGLDTLIIDTSGLAPDTTDMRENNDTQDFTMQLNYDANLFNLQHTVAFSYITSNRDDVFGLTRLDSLNTQKTSSNVQVFSVRTRYNIPLTTTINVARNDNTFGELVKNGANNFKFNMFGARADYYFFDRKLQLFGGVNLTTASGRTSISDTSQTVTDYNRTGFNLGFRYELTRGHFFLVDGHIIQFNDNGGTRNTQTGASLSQNPSFTDRIIRVYYEKRF